MLATLYRLKSFKIFKSFLCSSPHLKSFNQQHLECFRDGAPGPLSPVDRPSCPGRPPAASSSSACLAPGVRHHVQSQAGVALEL